MANDGLIGWWKYSPPKRTPEAGITSYLHRSWRKKEFIINVTSDCADLLPMGDAYYNSKRVIKEVVIIEEDWPHMRKLKPHEVAAYFL